MIKQSLFFLMLAFGLSLSPAKAQSSGASQAATTKGTVYTLGKLFEGIDTRVGKEVRVRGIVTHVCKHAGCKLFITGDDGKGSMQVMAKGKIKAFDQELVGSEIEVTGTVQEYRMEKDAIDGQENAVHDLIEKKEGSMEQCEAVLANVKEMREWMEKNKKDYFAIFYVDGMTYETID